MDCAFVLPILALHLMIADRRIVRVPMVKLGLYISQSWLLTRPTAQTDLRATQTSTHLQTTDVTKDT